MKRFTVSIFVMAFAITALGSDGILPSDPLVLAHAERGTTPEGALHLWFEAVYLYQDEATRDLGRDALAFLTIPFKKEREWERLPSNRTFVQRLVDPAYAHIFRSYAKGTNPGNAYAMDRKDFELDVVQTSEDRYGRGWRVLLRSSGADIPRPVYMKKSTSTGLWYVSEFANVYLGTRPPVEEGEEEFE